MQNEMINRLVDLIKQAKQSAKNANCDLERNMLFVDDLIQNGVIVPPVKAGDELDGRIVDQVTYKTMACFDGGITTVEEVHLRDKEARGPIYTTQVISFEEAERLKRRSQNDRV